MDVCLPTGDLSCHSLHALWKTCCRACSSSTFVQKVRPCLAHQMLQQVGWRTMTDICVTAVPCSKALPSFPAVCLPTHTSYPSSAKMKPKDSDGPFTTQLVDDNEMPWMSKMGCLSTPLPRLLVPLGPSEPGQSSGMHVRY